MARRVSSPELIGRDEELDSLAAALRRAGEGEFRAVLVAGEAGVGKTRLLGEFRRRADDLGARILAGECVELAEGELPFAPLTAMLRPLARELGAAELEALPGSDELARLLPELGDTREGPAGRDSALDESLAQSRLFEVLLALFDRLGADGPVVLIVEDLHWADRSTRDFLGFLVRNAQAARLLLVCTYRSDELHRTHPLRPFLAELERREPVERLELDRLTREELEALLEGIVDEPPTPALVDELFVRSDGNPFFAEELLAASATGGSIPATLRDALMLRVEGLSDSGRRLLRVAGAAGRSVSHRLLNEVAGLDERELDEAIREAVACNALVQDGDSFSFRHALLREAVVLDILPGEQTKLHVALAEALTHDPTLGDGGGGIAAAEVAYHWWHARRYPEAFSSSLEAGRAAERAYAFAEAHRHLESALEIWAEVPDAAERAGADHATVLARAAENANLIGEPARAVALAREAIEEIDRAGDAVRAALARERLGRYLWVAGDAPGALESYHEAVDLMPPEPPSAELAKVLAAHGQILMLRGRPRESRERCEQAIEVARSVGARAEEGHALNTLGVDISSLGDRQRGIEYLHEAKRIAEELGWVDEIGRVYTNLSEEIDWHGRTEESVELTLEGAAVMRRLGARSYVLFLESEAAARLMRLGRVAEAASVIEAMRGWGASGIGSAMCGDVEADLALLRGDPQAALAALRESQRWFGRIRDSMFFGPTAAIEVESVLAAEGPEPAVAMFERVIGEITGEEYAFSIARLYSRGLRAYAELAERARAAGDAETLSSAERGAEAAIDRFDDVLAPERFEEGDPVPFALAHRAVAAAELSRVRGESDPGLWAASAERWRDLGLRLERAYSQWRRAEALLLAGAARAEAATALNDASEALADTGTRLALHGEIEALARRARIAIDGAGSSAAAATPAEAPAQRLGLTDRELEVLELLVEGCTNREIGERLFMAEKTASVHVSRILAKLEVRSRLEAATKAQRLGLAGAAGAGVGP